MTERRLVVERDEFPEVLDRKKTETRFGERVGEKTDLVKERRD